MSTSENFSELDTSIPKPCIYGLHNLALVSAAAFRRCPISVSPSVQATKAGLLAMTSKYNLALLKLTYLFKMLKEHLKNRDFCA